MYLILYSFFFLFLELGWLNHNLFIYKYNMKRLLKNGYLMFFGCIVLNGNALHAVVLFRNTKSKKKRKKGFAVWSPQAGCAFTDQGWATEPVLSLSLSLFLSSMSLFLFHVVLWILVTFHSMQSLQSPMLWCSEQTASELVLVCDNFFFLSFALTCLKWEPSHWQKKYFRLFKWTGFYFFMLCFSRNALRVLMKHVPLF